MSCFQSNAEDFPIMDPKIIQSVASHEQKLALQSDKVIEIEKRIDEVKTLVESLRTLTEETKQHSNLIANTLEENYQNLVEEVRHFQLQWTTDVQKYLTEKHSSRLEAIEHEIQDLFQNIETVHMKQNCGIAGALLSASLYLAMLTLGS
jgi:formate-dependent nitrite reductase cytochrome c552 subunit